jgi:hypothetical protein
LVLLQVNCGSIYNKALEFWNLVDLPAFPNPLTLELNPSAQRCLPRFLLLILIFKGLTAQRVYKSFGVKGLNTFQVSSYQQLTLISYVFNTTLSNPIFLPPAYSPTLIYFGWERGWWITCKYLTILKEKNRNRKSTTCTICWLNSVLHEEKCREQETHDVRLHLIL